MKEYPRLPMVYFEFKLSPSTADISTPIKKFIREYYGDDGEKYNKEIKEIEALRNAALRPSRDMTGCLTLKRYYSQLYTLYNKVKIMKGDLPITFTWQDVYSGQPVTGDIQFELDCLMYNIGALHAELGALNLRDNAENLRVACTHFQCSVWAFEQLKEQPHNKSKDMSHDIIAFIYQTVMAQAQECILGKSIMDNRKNCIIARVAAQVIEYYNSALSVLIQSSLNSDMDIAEIVGSKLFEEWKKFTEFKISYYSAVCALYMGDACQEQQKTGEQIAWYISGTQHLEQAEKLSKSLGKIEINLLSKALAKKKETAERDNDFVYHQPVPSSDKLTAVKGAPLATGVGFNVSDPEVCGKDIFARLVPIEAHEMASVYSENKDRILREMRTKVEDKDEELLTYLSSLQLDKDNLRPVANIVPDELIEICAELSVKPNICKDTQKMMDELNSISSEAQKNLDQAATLIEDEEEKEKKHQDKFGKRAPSMIIGELRKELEKHEETQSKSLAANKNLSQALEKLSKDIQLLIDCSAKDLERLLPPITDIPFDEDNIKEIEKLLDKVQEMKNQRASLEKQLREEVQSDDVLKHVIAHSKDELETIFEKELAKYDKTVSLLEQNLAAQENILNALTKASASYGKSRMALNEVNRLRVNRIQTLLTSFDGFMKVKDNIEKGLEFYKEFLSITNKMLTRLKSVIKVQDEERLQLVEAQIKKETFNLNTMTLSNSKLPEIPSSASNRGGPKLKDFLPYMSSRYNPSPDSYANNVFPVSNNQVQSYQHQQIPAQQVNPPNHSAYITPQSFHPPPTSTPQPQPQLQIQPQPQPQPQPQFQPQPQPQLQPQPQPQPQPQFQPQPQSQFQPQPQSQPQAQPQQQPYQSSQVAQSQLQQHYQLPTQPQQQQSYQPPQHPTQVQQQPYQPPQPSQTPQLQQQPYQIPQPQSQPQHQLYQPSPVQPQQSSYQISQPRQQYQSQQPQIQQVYQTPPPQSQQQPYHQVQSQFQQHQTYESPSLEQQYSHHLPSQQLPQQSYQPQEFSQHQPQLPSQQPQQPYQHPQPHRPPQPPRTQQFSQPNQAYLQAQQVPTQAQFSTDCCAVYPFCYHNNSNVNNQL
ncbi:tyrosine-protein phosphatase non-receptor type 23-like [Tetranychus urticae]|uniref:BRO1 domain-containing protein n=1 Tax=Tetranychus urticae TaxID=32264 RepID=T1L3V4_TETUR|nr:tyrosine-protein phosphatase non-receptor type 23-like [Tetranychus urticae]